MTRYAKVGEGRKRPLEATKWKDMKQKRQKAASSKSLDNENGGTDNKNEQKNKDESFPKENNSTPQEQPQSLENVERQVTNCEKDHAAQKQNGAKLPYQDKDDIIHRSPKRKSDKKHMTGGKKFKSDKRESSELECYNCHKKGHKVSDCPEPSDGKMDNVECYHCKQKGHKAFKCPNADTSKISVKKQKFQNPNPDFIQFQTEFRLQWNKKHGLSKALREAYKKCSKESKIKYAAFKKKFRKQWDQETGYNKALREEWKNSGRELTVALRKQEKSEERRLKRQEKKESEKHCFNCRGSGHQLSECPELRKDVDQGTGICFKCGSTEHAVNKCSVKVPDGQFPFAKCFICGETGHLSKQCPDNPRGLYPNGGCCKVCGSVEHLKKDCPELQKKQGIGSMTLAVMDSSKSGDWEDIKQNQPKKEQGKTGPKIVKF